MQSCQNAKFHITNDNPIAVYVEALCNAERSCAGATFTTGPNVFLADVDCNNPELCMGCTLNGIPCGGHYALPSYPQGGPPNFPPIIPPNPVNPIPPTIPIIPPNPNPVFPQPSNPTIPVQYFPSYTDPWGPIFFSNPGIPTVPTFTNPNPNTFPFFPSVPTYTYPNPNTNTNPVTLPSPNLPTQFQPNQPAAPAPPQPSIPPPQFPVIPRNPNPNFPYNPVNPTIVDPWAQPNPFVPYYNQWNPPTGPQFTFNQPVFPQQQPQPGPI